MAVKIVMGNQKGGIGKTTTSIELSACFKALGYKVLLVDLEQQCDTTKYSGGDINKPGSYDALMGTVSIKDAIQKVDEYDLLSASPMLSRADKDFADYSDSVKLRKILREINDDYDFILMDTNPGRNVLLNMAYMAADYIIIPAECDDASLEGIRNIVIDIKDYIDNDMSEVEVLGVVYCRYENTGQHRYQFEKIKEFLEGVNPDAFLMTVRKCIQATEAKSEGMSMQKCKHGCTAARDYRDIADKIIEIVVGEE